jgi:hypothetical protein
VARGGGESEVVWMRLFCLFVSGSLVFYSISAERHPPWVHTSTGRPAPFRRGSLSSALPCALHCFINVIGL